MCSSFTSQGQRTIRLKNMEVIVAHLNSFLSSLVTASLTVMCDGVMCDGVSPRV